MSSAVPVPPPPAERLARSSNSRARRSLWRRLRRSRQFRRVLSTVVLWAGTVVAVWFILKQIIK